MPTRIQRKRTKGWRMPENAIYVGRPTQWGNPYQVGSEMRDIFDPRRTARMTVGDALHFYRGYVRDQGPQWLNALRGRDLACWCPLDQPCHADVLLELANHNSEAPAALAGGETPHET
jgi:hypothetical protein